MNRAFIVAIILVASPAFADDLSNAQRAATVLQAQRNQAMDMTANAELRAADLADQLKKAQDQIKELEAKIPKDEPKKE